MFLIGRMDHYKPAILNFDVHCTATMSGMIRNFLTIVFYTQREFIFVKFTTKAQLHASYVMIFEHTASQASQRLIV